MTKYKTKIVNILTSNVQKPLQQVLSYCLLGLYKWNVNIEATPMLLGHHKSDYVS